jgi:hypothetical protein
MVTSHNSTVHTLQSPQEVSVRRGKKTELKGYRLLLAIEAQLRVAPISGEEDL